MNLPLTRSLLERKDISEDILCTSVDDLPDIQTAHAFAKKRKDHHLQRLLFSRFIELEQERQRGIVQKMTYIPYVPKERPPPRPLTGKLLEYAKFFL